MKRIALSILAATTVISALPAAASAQSYNSRHSTQVQSNTWVSINQRQVMLDRRIDQGVRNRTLTRSEAARLRAEFRQIVRIEAQYRRTRPGLTLAERRDLDRRFDLLSARIRYERNDRDYRRDNGNYRGNDRDYRGNDRDYRGNDNGYRR